MLNLMTMNGYQRISKNMLNLSPGTSPIEGVVTENDLEHLLDLLKDKDGEIDWKFAGKFSNPTITYQAWLHVSKTGQIATTLCRTVFEDATPEIVRDFFWDDEYRSNWDRTLAHMEILKECSQTGMMMVRWIKKYPCDKSGSEFIIGRRIWEAGKTFYCVTKGIPYPALQSRDKPKRVDYYFSSWVIKPVQSPKGDGRKPACEVTLVHYEDGENIIDKQKLGVQHYMWECFRAYQKERESGVSLSRFALMARNTTQLPPYIKTDHFEAEEKGQIPDTQTENPDHFEAEEKGQIPDTQTENGDFGFSDRKLVVSGGALAMVCGLRKRSITRTNN